MNELPKQTVGDLYRKLDALKIFFQNYERKYNKEKI